MFEISKNLDNFCFCTLAFGKKYNFMAQLLAQDLYQFAPNYPFIIYTDRPHIFEKNLNVIAFKHSCRGVLPYNERRFAIWKALSISSSVIYLDADVRICAPVPQNLNFLPGLTARSCGSLQKHMKEQFNRNPGSSQIQHKKYVIEKMARRVGIDFESPELKFINEFLFVVTAHKGRELEFLKIWGDLAIYADTLGMHKHPTYAMALAAAKSNFPIYHSEINGLDFFDDRIERVRISKGQSTPESKAQYFYQQSSIEQVKQNLWQRFSRQATTKFSFLYNCARVQIASTIFPSALVNYPISNSDH